MKSSQDYSPTLACPINDYIESDYKNPMKRYQRKSRASRKSESRSRITSAINTRVETPTERPPSENLNVPEPSSNLNNSMMFEIENEIMN